MGPLVSSAKQPVCWCFHHGVLAYYNCIKSLPLPEKTWRQACTAQELAWVLVIHAGIGAWCTWLEKL